MSHSDEDDDQPPPTLRVVHGGDLTPDELAALVVALNTAGRTAREPTIRRSGWADRRALVRRPLEHGPGRWAASARPAG